MSSLKSFLPIVAGLMGVTPAALYTRQRALVEMGVMTYVQGRGPGSGSPLSGENLAALVIALMTADTLQETDRRVKEMCRAFPHGPKNQCPWTGQKTLQRAFGSLFDNDETIKSFAKFSITRGSGAVILYGSASSPNETTFATMGRLNKSAIQITAQLEATSFRQLFAAYRAVRL